MAEEVRHVERAVAAVGGCSGGKPEISVHAPLGFDTPPLVHASTRPHLTFSRCNTTIGDRGGFRGGRGGGRGGGGYGGYDQGPPAQVVEAGVFEHPCEGEAVCKLTNTMIPYFNAPIFLENKTQVGKVEEVFGPINSVYFTIKMSDGVVADRKSVV